MTPKLKIALYSVGIIVLLLAVNVAGNYIYSLLNPSIHGTQIIRTDSLVIRERIINEHEKTIVKRIENYKRDSIIISYLPDNVLWDSLLAKSRRLSRFDLQQLEDSIKGTR